MYFYRKKVFILYLNEDDCQEQVCFLSSDRTMYVEQKTVDCGCLCIWPTPLSKMTCLCFATKINIFFIRVGVLSLIFLQVHPFNNYKERN